VDDNDLNFELNVTSNIEITQHKEIKPAELEDFDYTPSNELLSADESNDEVTNKRRYSEFNATTDMANPYFQIGMVFDSFKAFKEAVIEYAIKERKNIPYA
jgi:hypothetical protein